MGLVPFKINDLTKAVNPIKLREYLAAGLPVVSTPLPEANRCNDSVEIAGTAEDFVTSIATTLASATADRSRRSAAMAVETWQEKVAAISGALASVSGPEETGNGPQ